MKFSRKEFLQVSLKSILVIGLGNGLESLSDPLFEWPSREKIKLRFALASDGHYGQPDTEYDFYHDKMVGWLNAEKNGRGMDFAMINGDMFHNEVSFLPQVKKKWDQLEMPYYVSRGNHDHTDGETWEKTWGIPLNHAFEMGDAAFLILDTSDIMGAYVCPDAGWARNQMLRYESKKFLFVFMHITPFNWTRGGMHCPELVKLFDTQKNLKAIFHGHDHDQDNVKKNNGRYYFFDSHVGGNWGTDYRGYRMVEILDNGKILTYQMNASARADMNRQLIR